MEKRGTSHFNNSCDNRITRLSKCSQVTIFIIIAVLLVVAILIYFLVRGLTTLPEEKREVSPDIMPVHSFVEQCLNDVGEDAIYFISSTGGYYEPPENYIDEGISIYFDKGRNYMPSKQKIEQELSKYVDEMLFFCTNNFIDFDDFQIRQEQIDTKANIEPGKVVFEITYPLAITKGEKTFFIQDFKTEVPVRLNTVYDMIYELMQDQMTHENTICVSCIHNLTIINDLYVEMNDYDNNTVIFSVIDENSKVNNQDLIFNFVNKYDFQTSA